MLEIHSFWVHTAQCIKLECTSFYYFVILSVACNAKQEQNIHHQIVGKPRGNFDWPVHCQRYCFGSSIYVATVSQVFVHSSKPHVRTLNFIETFSWNLASRSPPRCHAPILQKLVLFGGRQVAILLSIAISLFATPLPIWPSWPDDQANGHQYSENNQSNDCT